MTQFIDEFSREIWEQTYKDHTDNTVDDTFRRVARALASVEKTEDAKREWEEKFYDLMSDFKGGPGGRTFANAGTEFHGTTLLNCFLAPRAKENIDSLEGIIKDLKNQAMTLKSEGGWGQNFSFIRPRGAFINGIGVASPGAVKYMELYDKSSEIVTAGSGKKSENKKAKGKIRKGAMMGALDCTHPDIIEFITAKQQSGRLTKFNISINCTNEFMDRLIKLLDLDKNSEEFKRLDQWNLRFPDTTFERYNQEWDGNLKNWETKGYPVKIYQTVSATWLWNLIMESTYNRAEPGILFLDRADEYNPGYYFESIQGVNPCTRGDTKVQLPDNKTIEIEQLVKRFKDGESFEVLSMNLTTGKIESDKIINACMTKQNAELLELVFDDGNILYVTPDHRIYTKNRGYVEAQYLTEDDDVVTNETR